MGVRTTVKNADVWELYPIGDLPREIQAGPTATALQHLQDAQTALDALEESVPGGTDRCREEGLLVAREGIRRAWLAVSNLARDLDRQAWQKHGCLGSRVSGGGPDLV